VVVARNIGKSYGLIGTAVRSVGVGTWLIVTQFQSVRSLVVKYGFEACS
jgi:hypothetical protein